MGLGIMIESYNNPDQITSPDKFEEDVLAEQSLRPNSFDGFVGQQETVENLKLPKTRKYQIESFF